MKKKDFLRELRGLNLDELESRKKELRDQFANLRFKLGERLLKNPLQLRMIRHYIAVVNTVLREKGNQSDKGQEKDSAGKSQKRQDGENCSR